MIKDVLQKVPLLADLADEDLERLATLVRRVEVEGGTELFEEGSVGQEAYVIESGELEIIKQSSGRKLLLAVRKPGEVIGEMSLLEDTPRMASARARCQVRVLAIDKDSLEQLLQMSPSAARTLLYGVLARYKATGAMLRQGERMAQLGTLTAGVAHELNNPAAAVRRGAAHLMEALTAFGAAERHLGALGLGEHATVTRLAADAAEHAVSPVPLPALERSDRQSDLEEWLEEVGVDEPWELSGALVDLGQTKDTLGAIASDIGADKIAPVAAWLARTHETQALLAEIVQGATRVSEIVKALKTYSFLDQAPVQEVDVHEGLDSTLLILRSKLKQGIEIRREYASDLPKIQAYGSELNQVWTNIIDNAADALGGKGTITIRTRHHGNFVEVEIEDDGPGIPEEIQSKIFDSFFTTKPPGKGTGLGLDISYNIVVNRHRGDLKVVSRPGMTRFCVSLPLDFDKEEVAPRTISGTELSTDEQLLDIVESMKTVAVVGMRDRPGSPAYDVPSYVQHRGFRVLPVNPTIDGEILGEKAYPNLKTLPLVPDVVLVFRQAEHVPAIVDDAIAVGAKVVWMQEGIVHHQAATIARDAGLRVVMDTCLRSTIRRLLPRERGPSSTGPAST